MRQPLAYGLAFLVSFFFAAALLVVPRVALADPPGARATPVHVLGIDTDDAEDQADALTGALRSRVRTAPGWSLQETQHSLGMLTAALRCPPLPQRPDAACTARIGDQLHTDRFVWGVMSKAPGSQVTAEVHLWSRGKADVSVKETYSDNLKDANDETLRKIAARIFDRLTGSSSTGTITVRAGDAEGIVWINGQRKQQLDHGAATIEMPAGTYAVEVRAPGFATAQQSNVVVNPGADTQVAMRLTPAPAADVSVSTSGKPSNVRRVIAWTAIGVGVAAIIGGGVEGLRFLSLKSDLDADRQKIDRSVVDVCSVPNDPNAVDACGKFNDAKSARTIGAVLGSAGVVATVVGVVLLVTDHPRESPPADQAAKWTVTPYATPRGGAGATLAVTF